MTERRYVLDETAACVHGSDDPKWCWGCLGIAGPANDSEAVFLIVERLTARGYRVTVSIELPSGGGMTLTGEPDGA